LRHLHAVNWLKDGRSIYDLQKRLGHTSIKTTEGYLQFLTAEEELIVKGLKPAAVASELRTVQC
jgi:integrase/recombinase XerD